MKNITAGIALLISAASPTFADETADFSGPYIAGDLGVQDGEFYKGVSLGYRKQLENNWVYGGEFSYGEFNAKSNAAPGTSDIESKDFKPWSLALTAGKAMGDGLAFANLGYSKTKATEYDLIQKSDGFLIGVGYEHKFTKNISARIKGDYIRHKDSGIKYDDYRTTAGLVFQF